MSFLSRKVIKVQLHLVCPFRKSWPFW